MRMSGNGHTLGIGHPLRTPLLLIAIVCLSAGSALADQLTRRDGNPVIHWNRIATEIFPVEIGPILDARAMAILHAAIHDAVNGVERRYEPYTADLSFPAASVDAAVASAAHEVMLALVPGQQPRIDQEYAAALADVRDGPAKEQGVTLGQQAARANLERRDEDGIVPRAWPPQQGPITEPVYVPTGKPGDYDFTPPFDAPPLGPIALFPGWGRLTPFVVDLARHRLHGPDPLRSKRYARDFNFLKANGSLHSATRTPDQTDTAFFWFEPFAVWNDIAVTAMQQERVNPWQAARILALMNLALVDASIACFDAKYRFRFWRPYTAIRRGGEDDNDETEAGTDWLPLLWTPPGEPLMFLIPPIPDYPSAAAMESAAAAAVLTSELGDSVAFAVGSTTLPGRIRRFNHDVAGEPAREIDRRNEEGGVASEVSSAPLDLPSVEELFGQYRPRIHRHVRTLVHDRGDAEDLTQETFLRAHQRLDTLRNPAALGAWLYRIATCVCYDFLRGVAREPARATASEEPASLAVAARDPGAERLASSVR